MEELYFQYLGEHWGEDLESKTVWNKIDRIPDEELWRTHERRRERLVAFARRSLIKQLKKRGGTLRQLQKAAEVLDPTVLTIGFARRFVQYKRPTLIFKDLERLTSLINNPEMPVQIIFAGKAHPKDDEGKRLVQDIIRFTESEEFQGKIIFLENYDMNVARYLVEGCDIWLNNPRRPLEASGTSGMKVIANGGLNFSILDGWWDEAYTPEVGFKIGNGEEYEDTDEGDEIEAKELCNALEQEIIPLFYDRADEKIPRKWIALVKSSMKELAPVFNTHRMVREYFEKFYLPASQKRKLLTDADHQRAKQLAEWKQKVRANWNHLRISDISVDEGKETILVGDKYTIESSVQLGELKPEDVEVQIYYGLVDKQSDPSNNSISVMKLAKNSNLGNGTFRYTGSILCKDTGMQGYTLRVLPKHELMIHPYELGIVFWARE
jgi:starch phosphorylase